jgi:UDP-2,3-diacylglucosamine pyrophosphatase LpxH
MFALESASLVRATGIETATSGSVPTAGSSAQPALRPDSPRTIVIVSDLRMGEGRDAAGNWRATEDFRWGEEFGRFLDAVDREGTSAVDLVLNGDTFELLEPSEQPCSTGDDDWGCSEPAAREHLARILTAHRGELRALGTFAAKGSNRVVFVPGDHDAALLFPSVARVIVETVAAPNGRALVTSEGSWTSTDRRVHVEHGHQVPQDPHRFEGWPLPFVTRDGRRHLTRPWGERVVQSAVNALEGQFPIVDNVAAAGAGLKLALAADGSPALAHVDRLLSYFVFTTPWQQFRMELDDGDVEPPQWEVNTVLAQGASLLVDSLPDDDRFKPFARQALAEGRLASVVAALTDEQVIALCDYRAAIRRARRRFEPALTQLSPRGPAVAECPRTPDTRGAAFEYFWRSRDAQYSRYLDALQAAAPGRVRPDVLVLGHSLLPDRAQDNANMISGNLLKIALEGFSPVRHSTEPVVIRGGAWQRTITPNQVDQLVQSKGAAERDVLGTLTPSDLRACYSFVEIGHYTDSPKPRVRYWRANPAGEWGAGPSCPAS